jgi:hypothetical protein
VPIKYGSIAALHSILQTAGYSRLLRLLSRDLLRAAAAVIQE